MDVTDELFEQIWDPSGPLGPTRSPRVFDAVERLAKRFRGIISYPKVRLEGFQVVGRSTESRTSKQTDRQRCSTRLSDTQAGRLFYSWLRVPLDGCE